MILRRRNGQSKDMRFPFIVPVVGVTFHADAARKAEKGADVTCRHQPANPYDPNAVAVHLEDGAHIGYLPALVAARLVAAGWEGARGTVAEIHRRGGRRGLRIRLVEGVAQTPEAEAEPAAEVRSKSGRLLGTYAGRWKDKLLVRDASGEVVAYPADLVTVGRAA